ncbi:MAG TPA: hypothetical protein VJB11_01405, partial [archaeon]|nr:hypothetical protein [archaeon]
MDRKILYLVVVFFLFISGLATAAPTLTVISPINTTYIANASAASTANISLIYTASDASLDKCWYTNSTANNITLPNCAGITYLVSLGSNHN